MSERITTPFGFGSTALEVVGGVDLSGRRAVVTDVLDAVEKGVGAVGPGRAHDRLEYMRDFYTFLINEAPVLVERFEQQRRGEPRS